jgi:hypothetical protein
MTPFGQCGAAKRPEHEQSACRYDAGDDTEAAGTAR